MSTKTMSLYEALAMKKRLQDRVNKLRYDNKLVFGIIRRKHKDEIANGTDLATATSIIQSSYDSSVALINNYNELSAAINEANATIKVTIGGKEYSIANAIARHRGIDKEEELYMMALSEIRDLKERARIASEKYNSPETIADYLKKTLGDSKKDENLIKSMTEDYIKNFDVEFYDPMNMEEKATKKLEDIRVFRETIHYALTQANCNNTITVEFDD